MEDPMASVTTGEAIEKDKTLPLPGWLIKVYFVFPIVLYIPDAIFNYFVYSDGAFVPSGNNVLLQAAYISLWAFMSIGVVGMAYLLSVLAPWHWGQGHPIQAFFCAVGVVVATGITTWNSLAYRSIHFKAFPTDTWMGQMYPQLSASNISLTMILVAVAPPFWGLFWAIVQPTQTGRSLRQIQESHAERLLRLQQEAELKRLRAESNAKVRAAQLRGMAETAVAAREQAAKFLAKKSDGPEVVDGSVVVTEEKSGISEDSGALPSAGRVLQLPTVKAASGRGEAMFYNHAPAAAPSAHAGPSGAAQAVSQPPLLANADVQVAPSAMIGDPVSWPARRPPVPGAGLKNIIGDDDLMTGTTGPRPAIKRPGDNNTLFGGIRADVAPRGVAVVQQLAEELKREKPEGASRTISKKDLVARLQSREGIDESTAQRLVDQWNREYREKRSGRSSNR